MKAVISVAYHKPSPLLDSEVYMPVHAGAATSSVVLEGLKRDDDGENISDLNFTYCELTVIYWLWRNVDADVKGLIHYRRALGVDYTPAMRLRHLFHRVLGHESSRQRKCDFDTLRSQAMKLERCLPALMERYDLLVAKPIILSESVGDRFAGVGNKYLTLLADAIGRLHPEYVADYDRTMAGRRLFYANMTVMRSRIFDSYCSFLFSTLEDVRGRLLAESDDFTLRHDPTFSRCLGYLAEVVTHTFIAHGVDHEQYRVKTLPVYFAR